MINNKNDEAAVLKAFEVECCLLVMLVECCLSGRVEKGATLE